MAACASPPPPAAPSAEAPAEAAPGPSAADDGAQSSTPLVDGTSADGAAGAGGVAPTSGEPSSMPTSAPAAAPELHTLFVRDQTAPCEAEGTRECLQVRNAESEPWRNFFGTIQGFTYEPAYRYELRVEVVPATRPAADAPSVRYRLREVVSKHKAGQ